MKDFTNNINLRSKIQYVTDKYSTTGLKKQIDFINNLKNEHQHSIKIIEEWKEEYPRLNNFNCFSYALNLRNSERAKQIMIKYGNIYTGLEFINYLLENEILNEISWENAKDEDIIIYYEDNKPKHAGKIINKRVTSKWGKVHLWEHDIYEIPKEYGNECKFFVKIEADTSESCFLEFAKNKGVKI